MNNAIMIAKNLPVLLSNRSIIAFFVLAVLLGLGSISLSYYLLDSREQAIAVEKEIRDISTYMTGYRKKEADLKAVPNRPVEIKDLDAVQTDVLLLMQSCAVQIMDLKIVKDNGTKESQAIVYKEDEKKTAGEKQLSQTGPNAGDVAKSAAAAQAPAAPHRTYDVKIRGTYENIMTFVQKFGVKGKLLTIRKFAIAPLDDGTYVADLRYKIYVK